MTDEGIIKQVQNGNIEAYGLLIERYKNLIFNLIFKYTNCYEDSQDIAQEVFIKVYKQIHTFKYQSKISTWLYRIATNSCIDWDRKRRKEWNNISLVDEMAADHDEGPEAQIIFSEQKEFIRDIINKMPEKYKLLLILYHFQDLKYKEISEILDIPEKTIETRLYRARKHIKKEVEMMNRGGEALWIV